MSLSPESPQEHRRDVEHAPSMWVYKNRIVTHDRDRRRGVDRAVGIRYAPHHWWYISDPQNDREKLRNSIVREHTTWFLMNDAFSRSERAEIIGTYTEDPPIIPVATARVVFARKMEEEDGLPFMELTRFAANSDEILGDTPIKDYAELGRITVHRRFRKRELGKTGEVLKNLVDGPNGVVDLARERNAKRIVVTCKGDLRRYFDGTSLQFSKPHDIDLTEIGKNIAAFYPGYWKDIDDPPKVSIADVPEEHVVYDARIN